MTGAKEKIPALVLAVGLDDLTVKGLQGAVQGTEITLETVGYKGAVARVKEEDRPVVALLDWTAERDELQVRLCTALRRATRPGRCAVIALGGLADPALARAYEGGVDGVLIRPFGAEILFRLRHDIQTMESLRRARGPAEALDEALQSASGGEVVVRAGDVIGHIHVQQQGIVWADLSSVPATMAEVVRHAGVELDADVIAAATEECARTRAHFMDVLVAWSILDVERAKDAVRAFVAGRVKLALELPGAAAMFLPKQRAHAEHMRVSIEDIPSSRQQTLMHTPFPTALPGVQRRMSDITPIFRDAAAVDGVVGVALLDRRTGQSLLTNGEGIDGAVAWSQIGLLAALGPDADDVIASIGQRALVLRPLAVDPSLALFVVLDQQRTPLGLARALLKKIASRMPA